jgi:hypothetical protein
MSVSNSRLVFAAIIAAVLPISACSSGKEEVTKREPVVQPAPNVPSTMEDPLIPYSIQCGSRSESDANDPEVFSAEHVLITNRVENAIQLEHFRLPKEVVYEEGSADEFISAIEQSRKIIGAILLPSGVNGSAVITYPGNTPEEQVTYLLSVSRDGTIALNTNPENRGGVAVQSTLDSDGQQINVAYFENSRGDSSTSFLDPGKDEWDNVAEAPLDPESSEDHGFTPFEGGAGAHLNAPISLASSTRAGAQVFDPGTDTACVALTGEIAIEPRTVFI